MGRNRSAADRPALLSKRETGCATASSADQPVAASRTERACVRTPVGSIGLRRRPRTRPTAAPAPSSRQASLKPAALSAHPRVRMHACTGRLAAAGGGWARAAEEGHAERPRRGRARAAVPPRHNPARPPALPGLRPDQRLRVRVERVTGPLVCGAGVKRGDCSWCSGACRWTWCAPATLRRRLCAWWRRHAPIVGGQDLGWRAFTLTDVTFGRDRGFDCVFVLGRSGSECAQRRRGAARCVRGRPRPISSWRCRHKRPLCLRSGRRSHHTCAGARVHLSARAPRPWGQEGVGRARGSSTHGSGRADGPRTIAVHDTE